MEQTPFDEGLNSWTFSISYVSSGLSGLSISSKSSRYFECLLIYKITRQAKRLRFIPQLTTPVTRNCLCQLCDYFVKRCGLAMVDLPATLVDLPWIMVDLPNTMVVLLNTMVDLSNTMVDLPNTMVDLPNTMVDLPNTMTDGIEPVLLNHTCTRAECYPCAEFFDFFFI